MVKSNIIDDLIEKLIMLPKETEWVEFKKDNFNPDLIGKYISVLSNSACLHYKDYGYLLFGIEDKTHKVIGTKFKPKECKIGNEELENWLLRKLQPRVDFKIIEHVYNDIPIVIFKIDPTNNTPIKFDNIAYIRVGTYMKKLSEYPEKERKIWKRIDVSSTTKTKKAVIEAEGEKEAKPEEKEEKGLWDFVVDGEKSLKDITECMERMTKATKEISEKVKQQTVEVQKIAQSGVPGTASRIYKLTTTIAMDMTQYAKKLEEEQPKFHSSWESFDENITGLLQTTRIHDDKDKEAGLKFRSQVDDLRSSVRNALKGVRKYRESIANLKRISRALNQASKRTVYVLDLLISDLEGADSYCIKVLTLLDEKIEQEV